LVELKRNTEASKKDSLMKMSEVKVEVAEPVKVEEPKKVEEPVKSEEKVFVREILDDDVNSSSISLPKIDSVPEVIVEKKIEEVKPIVE